MNDIEVSLQDTQDISTQVYDINYIPDYVKAEEERRANETIRISNEQNRQANELLRVALYNDLEEKKEQDYWRGNGIVSTTKTGTSGLVDTYTITYDDGDTDTFTVTNGQDGDPGQDGQDATINGVNTLTIQEGENISITQSGSTMTISSTGGSGGTSDYTDLTNKPSINNVTLSGNKSLSDLGIQPSGNYVTPNDLSSVATSGSYNDLSNKPNIPSKTSELTNDSGYITGYTETDPIFSASASATIMPSDISSWNNKSDFSGDYNDLTNKPTIPTVPTNVSAFTNDVGYLTQHQDISGKENTSNKVTSITSSSTNTEYPSALAVYNLFNSIIDADNISY